MNEESIPTRTIALVGTVIALLALALTIADSSQSGTLAAFVAQNAQSTQGNHEAMTTRMEALEAQVKELAAAKAPEPAPEPAPADTDAPAE